jgi:hypothetical protein
MKQFYFNVNATIYKDDYKEGQGDQVNSWQNQELIEAETLDLAIEKLFETRLYFSYKKEFAQIQDCDDSINNILEYSNLVDENNSEVLESGKKYQAWKAGKINLYSCDLSIEIFELKAVDLNENYSKCKRVLFILTQN